MFQETKLGGADALGSAKTSQILHEKEERSYQEVVNPENEETPVYKTGVS